MKKLKTILVRMILTFVIYTLVLSLWVGIPYQWTITGEIVQDSTVYTGNYYKINDNLKILCVENKTHNEYDKYVVYKKENDKWVDTGAYAYVSMFSIIPMMNFYLHSEYFGEYGFDNKKNKKPF